MHKTCFTSGMTFADNTKDYGGNDYTYDDYPSVDYLNSAEYDPVENYPKEEETPIIVNPIMISKDTEQIIDEGHMIKLPCIVDKLGIV